MTTLVHRIREHALDRPGDPALYAPVGPDWKQLSWGVWWASIQQAAGGLLELGIATGEVVLLWGTARPEWAVAWPALCAIGARPLVLAPDVDDVGLLLATRTEPVRVAITQGRDRLERVLQLREQGGLALDRLVTLDRLDLKVPRMTDLERLIEQGALAGDGVALRMRRVTGESVAAMFEDGHQIVHDQLFDGAPGGLERVALSVDLRGAASLKGIAAAVHSGAELWFARETDRIVHALDRIQPDAIGLSSAGWKQVLASVEQQLGEAPGVAGALARQASVGGALEPIGRRSLAQLIRRAGLDGVRAWSTDAVDRKTLARLDALGIAVTAF